MAKIRIHIYTDEVYPVFYMVIPDDEAYSDVTFVDDDLYQKYLTAKKDWDEVQAKLNAIYFT